VRKLSRELRVAQELSGDYRYEVNGLDIHKASPEEAGKVSKAHICLAGGFDDREDEDWSDLAGMDMPSVEAYGKVKALFGDENYRTGDSKLAWSYLVVVDGILVEVSDYKCYGCHLRFDHNVSLAKRSPALRALNKLIASSPGVPVELTLHYDTETGRTEKWAPKA